MLRLRSSDLFWYPSCTRNGIFEEQNYQWSEFPTDAEYESEDGETDEVFASTEEELVFCASEISRDDGLFESLFLGMGVAEACVEFARDFVVGVNAFESGFVEVEVGFAEGVVVFIGWGGGMPGWG